MHSLATAAFLASLRQSHSTPVRVTARGPLGVTTLNRVLGGVVTVDRNAAVRRRATVEIADVDGLLIPQGPVRLVSHLAVVTSSAPADPGSAPLTVVTDGRTASTDNLTYMTIMPPETEQWVQIDLGKPFRIGSVRVWHYGDGRTFSSPRTEVSLDGETWTVVSTPATYAEPADGHLRTFDPMHVRYVRDYITGNAGALQQHWVEMQVFSAPDVISAYGGELLVERGVKTPAGTTIYVPLGTFGITDVDAEDKGKGVVLTVEAFDRALRVQRARLVQPYVVAVGTNVATAIRDLISSRVAGLTYAITPTSRTTPALFFDTGTDPWEVARKMADAIGYELFFDADGVCIGRPEPDPETARVVDTYTNGVDSHLLGVAKATSTNQTYSRVVVTGEAADGAAPVRVEVSDPALVELLGDVPYFLTSAFITTTDQAQEVGVATLRRVQTLSEQVKVDAIVNPALAEGDVVLVRNEAIIVDASYVVDGFTIPLSGGRHLLNMRKRKS